MVTYLKITPDLYCVKISYSFIDKKMYNILLAYQCVKSIKDESGNKTYYLTLTITAKCT